MPCPLRKFAILMSCVVLFSALLSACQFSITNHPQNPSSSENEPAIIDLAENISVDAEIVYAYERNDILRIECIHPGLDTFSLSVILYSLKEQQELGRITLGESDWYTGWTDFGFYVASLTEKKIQLFDSSCQLTRSFLLSGESRHLSFFSMNEAADTCFYGAGDVGELYFYDLPTHTIKYVGKMLNGYQAPLGYRNGYFYLAGNNDLLRIHEDAEYAETVYCDSRHLYKFIDMGIGSWDNAFYVTPSNGDTAFTISMQQEDEYPLAAEKSRFITISDGEEKDCLRLYNMIDNSVKTFVYPEIRYATFCGDKILVSMYDGQHHLYLINSTTDSSSDATFTTSTVPINGHTIPVPTIPTFPSFTTPPTSHLIDVPLIPQMPDFPTGCESVSAVMLLKYWGEKISVDDFVDCYLSKSDYFYSADGVYYGPNPFECFVGNPRTTNSFGCMAPVIYRALKIHFGNDDRIQNVTGCPLPDLCTQYISKGIPVLVWATIEMAETFSRIQWQLDDGTLYSWPANEHCMVLVGYDEGYYFFNDPYTGSIQKYPRDLAEDRYAALGKQALIITK